MDRRHFISSVAVATPGVLLAEPQAVPQKAPASTDPLLLQIYADMRRAFADAQSPETRAEGLAAFATSLSFWATYEASSGREARAIAAFQRRSRGRQRDDLITAAMSKHDGFHDEIGRVLPGIDAGMLPHRPMFRDEFEKGLTDLGAKGYTAQLESVAELLRQLRARTRGQQRIRFMREEGCDDIRRAIAWAEVEANLMCAAAIFDPPFFGPACAISMATLAMLQMTQWWVCGI
jgi:hypothetical protein